MEKGKEERSKEEEVGASEKGNVEGSMEGNQDRSRPKGGFNHHLKGQDSLPGQDPGHLQDLIIILVFFIILTG